MSGRIVNVRPKPGFLMDGSGDFAPAPSNVVSMFSRDRLTNAMSGMGTSADKRSGLFYAHIPVTADQAEASYRNSWLWRKIVDIPPFDMTRARRDWQAEGADIETVEAEERRLQLWPKLQRALILARLFGGGALVLGAGEGQASEPLDLNRIGKTGLRYIHVMSRHQLSEGRPRLDPEDPWFGQPDYFTINSGNGLQQAIHPSRVIAFVGQKLPEGTYLQGSSWFWGDPIMQSVGDAVKNADLAQAGFASLIDEAKLDIIKIPDLMSTTATEEGTGRVLARLAAASVGKSTWRALMIDGAEEWQQRQLSLDGMPELGLFFLQVAAGAADIPVTRLLGQAPKGFQSTGDGEERDYHSMIAARQGEMLSPALAVIDPLLLRSAIGSEPADIYYEFAPLSLLNEKDAATVEKTYADAFKVYTDSGAIPDDAMAKAAVNRMVESGRWPGLETAIEESKKELGSDEDEEQDETMLLPRPEQVKLLEKRGAVTAEQADRLITDAKPRSLYVSRKLLNAAAFIKWAKGQGFETAVPAADLHVTVCFSRAHVDWIKMGSPWNEDEKGQLRVAPGGARIVEALGDKGAVVLLFNSSALSWRHEELVRNGASHDFDEYQPHVTISYAGAVVLEHIEPFRGELVFGPEIFEEVTEDWEKSLTEA